MLRYLEKVISWVLAITTVGLLMIVGIAMIFYTPQRTLSSVCVEVMEQNGFQYLQPSCQEWSRSNRDLDLLNAKLCERRYRETLDAMEAYYCVLTREYTIGIGQSE